MVEKQMGDDAIADIDDKKRVIETDQGTFTTDATLLSWSKELPADVPEFFA